VLVPQPPLTICDDNNDGFGVFDLTQVINPILGGALEPVNVFFYETQTDAQFGVNAIPLPAQYTNIVAQTQIIYVGITSLTTGCLSVAPLTIIVHPRPQATLPSDLAVCDDNFDGIGVFNLALATPEVLGNINPNTHTVTYHLTQAQAQGGTNAISPVNSFSNTTANTQQIWVRVTTTATGCFDVVP
ncbi:hypothetical protein V6O07_05815, partial [Arthrospira platensis SPKY2]